MMTITYPVYNGIYVNMTNRCPCACTFCLRHLSDRVQGSDSLWLDREPTVKDVCDSIDTWDLSEYSEIVFCGILCKCNRLDKYVYHYTPRQYFEDNPWLRDIPTVAMLPRNDAAKAADNQRSNKSNTVTGVAPSVTTVTTVTKASLREPLGSWQYF